MCCEMICEEQHETWDRERISLHERERGSFQVSKQSSIRDFLEENLSLYTRRRRYLWSWRRQQPVVRNYKPIKENFSAANKLAYQFSLINR